MITESDLAAIDKLMNRDDFVFVNLGPKIAQEIEKADQLLTAAELMAASPVTEMKQTMKPDTITTPNSALATSNLPPPSQPKLTEFIKRIANGGKMSPAELLKIESDWQ